MDVILINFQLINCIKKQVFATNNFINNTDSTPLENDIIVSTGNN